jgi:hypothetical protein
MTKLDWTRTAKGRDGYDAALAHEWRSGPSGAAMERPDGSDSLKLLSAPTIYWAKEMARAYPLEGPASHAGLFLAARRAAATLYYRDGWKMIRSRVQAVHAKASTLNPFPSAFYAIYFDDWAMSLARGDHLNKIGAVPRHIDSFSSLTSRLMRARIVLRWYERPKARPELKEVSAYHDWMHGLYEDMKRARA